MKRKKNNYGGKLFKQQQNFKQYFSILSLLDLFLLEAKSKFVII